MAAITSSSILCALGAIYGVYVMVRHLKVARHDVSTGIISSFPIICGTLAWLSASFTFYLEGVTSTINAPLIAMLVSWCILAAQFRQKYEKRMRRRASQDKTTPY